MIGKRISPILREINDTLWEFEARYPNTPHEWQKYDILFASKIFMSVMLNKMFELQTAEKMDIEDMTNMAEKLGTEIRKLTKTYTDIDVKQLMSEYLKS